jgi:uncharacterized protein (TIGR02466 family)
MHVNLFGIPVYKTQLQEHSNIQKQFSEILTNDEYFKNIPTWYSNVDTTFGNRDADNLPWQNFIKSAMSGLKEYIEIFELELPAEYRIECWLNRYKKGQFQEVHNHAGESVISCAYMLNTPPNSGNFVFYKNAYDYFHQSELPKLTKQPFKYNNRVTPPLQEGDIIYFPSSLEHYVSNNNSNELRATISANFIIKEKQDG